MDAVRARRSRRRPRWHPVRRRLHEAGQPGRAADGGQRRGHHRRRLHRHGLLAHLAALRRAERDHRLPPHALRARRGRGGAGRDRARRRAHGVPGQPGRDLWATTRGASAQSASCATAWASRTRPVAARRCRSRAASSRSWPTPSSRRSARRRTTPSCPWSPSSRSTAAVSASTRPPTRPTFAASSPAATS